MPSVAKRRLSGSTDGRPVQAVATASPGTTMHTAVPGTVTGTWDEIWMWAVNADAVARVVTVQFGNTAATDGIPITLPPSSGLVLLIPGLVLQNGGVVRAYCAVASNVFISGYVNSVTA